MNKPKLFLSFGSISHVMLIDLVNVEF